MCGIWGIVAGDKFITDTDKRFLRSASIAGMLRGMDGTGVIFNASPYVPESEGSKKYVPSEPRTTYYKTGGTGVDLDTEFGLRRSTPTRCTAVVGHNRAATVGAISAETAHPFISSNIIGVHNGTLDQGWQKRLQVAKDCPVDSLGLYRALAARGPEWAITHAHGAMALVWVDTRTQEVFVYRNQDRPLCWGRTSSGSLIFASEAGMLQWVAERSNLTLTGMGEFDTGKVYNITDTRLNVVLEVDDPNDRDWGRAWSRVVGKDKAAPTPPAPQSAASGKAAYGHDDGIPFAGTVCLTKQQKDAGIVGEWVERGDRQYDCVFCDDPIDGDYIEDVEGPGIMWHRHCHHKMVGDIGHGFYEILRKCDSSRNPRKAA